MKKFLIGRQLLFTPVCFVFAIGILVLSSCSRKTNFQGSSVVPAAHGYVKIKKDNNKNYAISVRLFDLADADRLTPPAKLYIIWMDTEGQLSKNIGQIRSSGNLLSGRKKSAFHTVSSVKPTRIFITAENDQDVQSPGAREVLVTETF
ncbi:MAG: hypothetical protein JNM68_10210 [Dinghuibacter sp.]|nr:hypothetical protein [Dinghuibacter sp.]